MNDLSALQSYQQTRAETGSPAHLVVMLYEGAIRFVNEAEAAIERNDIPSRANAINRALRIVHELSNALDHEVGGEISQRLQALYDYVDYELLQATTFNELKHTRNAKRVLGRLLDSWRVIADKPVEAPPESPEALAPQAPAVQSDEPIAPLAPPTPPVYDPQDVASPGLSVSA